MKQKPKAKAQKPRVRLKPSSDQPSKAGLEEEVRVEATPEALLAAVVCGVEIEVDEEA